ncbi:hypothetical protein [Sphaerimonospora mesophila]
MTRSPPSVKNEIPPASGEQEAKEVAVHDQGETITCARLKR